MQDVLPVPVSRSVTEPGEHVVQTVAPADAEYVPAAHRVEVVAAEAAETPDIEA